MDFDRKQWGPFRSGSMLAQWAVIALGACGVAAAASLLSNIVQILISYVGAGDGLAAMGTEEDGVSTMQAVADLSMILLGLLQFVFTLATAVIFITWMYRAYSNLPALGVTHPQHGRGWVIGAWFVPFLNLVRPYEIIKELWRGSDPDAVERTPSEGAPLFTGMESFSAHPPWMTAWWVIWIIYNVLDRILLQLSVDVNTRDDLLVVYWLSLPVEILCLIAAVLAIRVVRGIDRRQQESFQKLQPATAFAGP